MADGGRQRVGSRACIWILISFLAFDMASSSLTADAPVSLFNLYPELLYKILKDVPLEDKLQNLMTMPEFQPFLFDREAFLDSPSVPFSTEYLWLLTQLRPGWYVDKSRWSHRCYLEIDRETLSFSIYHFLLSCGITEYQPDLKNHSYRGSIDRVKDMLNNLLSYFHYVEHRDISVYVFPSYGYILLDYGAHPMKMWFLEDKEYCMEIGKPCQLYECCNQHDWHFTVWVNEERTLTIQCHQPYAYYCLCSKPIIRLSPVVFTLSDDRKQLSISKAEPCPLAAIQMYQLEDDGHVELSISYNLSYPFRHTMDIKRRIHQMKQ